jgi:hypothetical protein
MAQLTRRLGDPTDRRRIERHGELLLDLATRKPALP